MALRSLFDAYSSEGAYGNRPSHVPKWKWRLMLDYEIPLNECIGLGIVLG